MHLGLYFLSILSLSLASVFNRLAAESPALLGTFRLSFASLGMFAVLVWQRKNPFFLIKIAFQKHSVQRLCLFCGLVLTLHLWTYSYAAQNTSIAVCMILFATNPLSTALGNFVFFKESFSKQLIFAYLLAFFAIVILFQKPLQNFFENPNIEDKKVFLGNLSALMSAWLYSAYILIGKKARFKLTNPEFTFLTYLSGAFGFYGLLWAFGGWSWPLQMHTWVGIAGLVLVSTFMGHALFSYLLKFLNVNWMSCGKLAEPIFASLAAFLVFHQTPPTEAFYAYPLTAISLVFLFVNKRTAI